MTNQVSIAMPKYRCAAVGFIDSGTGRMPSSIIAADSIRDAARRHAELVAEKFSLLKVGSQQTIHVMVTDQDANDPVVVPVIVGVIVVGFALDPQNIELEESPNGQG